MSSVCTVATTATCTALANACLLNLPMTLVFCILTCVCLCACVSCCMCNTGIYLQWLLSYDSTPWVGQLWRCTAASCPDRCQQAISGSVWDVGAFFCSLLRYTAEAKHAHNAITSNYARCTASMQLAIAAQACTSM
jgi:hypothetical protein